MTVFAVCVAGLFPFIHLGRAWQVYYMFPLPNQRLLWPNFLSPLMFDVIAISTYLTVSSLFWYTGMLPDLAAIRDRSTGTRHKIFKFLSLGWTGAHEQWRHYTRGYLFFAALATPLVISVHSVVSWDFALGIVPGWHTTIFAPYFVAGAIHSGLAMVLTLMIPLRKIFKYEDIITIEVLQNVAKTIVLTGLIVGLAYGTEYFIAWYSHNTIEMEQFRWRALGDYRWGFFFMVLVQHPDTAVVPVQKSAHDHRIAFCHFADHQFRHVVGAFCHHRRRRCPRVCTSCLGPLCPDHDRIRHHAGCLLSVFLFVRIICQTFAIGIHD